MLKDKISEHIPDTRRSQLISMCDTRWVERHESIARFVEMYVAVVHALDELQNWPRNETSQKAHQLLSVITRGSFVLALVVAQTFFSHTLPLCSTLQKVDCDLAECCNYVKCVLQVFSDMRQDSRSSFEVLFKTAQEMIAAVNGEEIAVPRKVARHTCRDNTHAGDATEHYRLSLFLPFLDFLVSELETRFKTHADILSSLQLILPKRCTDVKPEQFEHCIQFYDSILPSPSSVKSELVTWQKKWQMVSNEQRPHSAIDSFVACNGDFFPNVKALLCILTTLPVSTATAERSFSTLKRIKTYLRNSMGDSRLSGLALLSIHREIEVNPAEVLDRFAKAPRRDKLLL